MASYNERTRAGEGLAATTDAGQTVDSKELTTDSQNTTRKTYTIPEAAALLGVSRDVAYDECRSGYLCGVRVLQVGRRKLIPAAAFDRMLDGELEQPADVPGGMGDGLSNGRPGGKGLYRV